MIRIKSTHDKVNDKCIMWMRVYQIGSTSLSKAPLLSLPSRLSTPSHFACTQRKTIVCFIPANIIYDAFNRVPTSLELMPAEQANKKQRNIYLHVWGRSRRGERGFHLLIHLPFLSPFIPFPLKMSQCWGEFIESITFSSKLFVALMNLTSRDCPTRYQ